MIIEINKVKCILLVHTVRLEFSFYDLMNLTRLIAFRNISAQLAWIIQWQQISVLSEVKFRSISIPTYEKYNQISLINATHNLYHKSAAQCLSLLASQTRVSAPDACPNSLPD